MKTTTNTFPVCPSSIGVDSHPFDRPGTIFAALHPLKNGMVTIPPSGRMNAGSDGCPSVKREKDNVIVPHGKKNDSEIRGR